MLKQPPKTNTESPFFHLLSSADEVQIREIASDQPERMLHSLEKTLKDFDHEKDSKNLRTFFVHIKTPAPTPKDESAKLPYDGHHLLHSAELLLENQDYLLARNLFSYLLQQNIKDPGALRGLGICLFKLGEAVSSRKCFRALIELHQSEEAHYWLALGYQAEAKDIVAVEHFNQIKNPQSFNADQRFDYYKNYGNSLTRMGQLDRAEGQYLKALELSPTSDTIHVNLGTLLIQRQEWGKARERFSRAAELNPNSSRAQCGLGMTALALDRKAEAKKFFHHALDLDTQNLVALHQLLELSTAVEEIAGLKTRLRAFLDKDPNHADSHFALAALLFKEGSWKACEIHATRATEIDPKHERAIKLKSDLNALVRNQTAQSPKLGL